jgi:SAM-dependent methyltransferase
VLESLHRRPRGRALAPLLSELTAGRVPAERELTPEEIEAQERERAAERAQRLLQGIRRYRPPRYEDVLGPPSRGLLARLDEADAAEARERVEEHLRPLWDGATPADQERLKLIFGTYYCVPGILEKTGLRIDQPPEDVHAMGRGPIAAGGDFWIADLLATSAERCGLELRDGSRVLDFGCSSGRHLRVFQAWRPEIRWLGCDPNEQAIAWASEHLPGIDFFVSPQDPPLELDAASLDLVTAVSVWSHFAPGAAERWLAEMHRLVRPGGLLVLTTQGFASVAFYLGIDAIPPEHATEVAEDLVATGHHYRPAFGEDGDWGVKSEEWGMAYMTMDWLAGRATPGWSLALHHPARIDTNQDVVVLRRESA